MSPRRLAKLLAWFGSATLAAIVVVTIWVVRHRANLQLATEAASVIPGTLLSARNFHWTQMKGDQQQWQLTARAASFSDDKKSLHLTDAVLSMVAQDGQHLTVHAPAAVLQLQGSHVQKADLSGGLSVRYGKVLLTGEQAAFAPDSDELEMPGPVTIEGEGFKVTGVGLTAHPHAETFKLHQQVSTQVVPKGDNSQTRKML
jgi:LPS export ABC transporter protein LptC